MIIKILSFNLQISNAASQIFLFFFFCAMQKKSEWHESSKIKEQRKKWQTNPIKWSTAPLVLFFFWSTMFCWWKSCNVQRFTSIKQLLQTERRVCKWNVHSLHCPLFEINRVQLFLSETTDISTINKFCFN